MSGMTADEFRTLAMALPGVSEATHQGHADFRVRPEPEEALAAAFAHHGR